MQEQHTIHPDNTAKDKSVNIIKEYIYHHQEMGYQTEEIKAWSVTIKIKTDQVIGTSILFPITKYYKEIALTYWTIKSIY